MPGSVPCGPGRLGLTYTNVHIPCLRGWQSLPTRDALLLSIMRCQLLTFHPFSLRVKEVLMEPPSLWSAPAWLRCTQERASTVPPQGQVPSPGLVPLSPVLTRCCPSRRKQPHLAEWIPSSTGRLRREERKREKGTKRTPLAELRLQCTQLASRGQQTLNLAQVTVVPDLRTALFSSLLPLLLTPRPTHY